MFKPLVVMPSYNSGPLLGRTIGEVLRATGHPLWVVIDGSTDGSEAAVEALPRGDRERVRVIRRSRNGGKGAAVRTALEAAEPEGFTHALVMDADGQHPAESIERFFAEARAHPEALVIGQPEFGEDVPWERLYGRRLSVWVVRFEVGGDAVGDPLFGFRVYPIPALRSVMNPPSRSNRYDFDPEVAVRMCWRGIPTVKVSAPVRYVDAGEGGVSHFHYLRDNLRYIWLHTRLVLQAPLRWWLK